MARGKAVEEATPAVDPENLASQLKALGAELQAVGEDKEQQATLLKQVEKLLGSIRVKDMPELAESPIIQQFVNVIRPADMRPGEVRNKGTLAEVEREWSWKDMVGRPVKTWTPSETIAIIWNGIQVQLYRDDEVTLPDVFYDVWREHVMAVRQAEANKQYLLGLTDRPPAPAWLNDAAAKVRAQSTGGKRGGGYEGMYQPGSPDWGETTTEEKKGG